MSVSSAGKSPDLSFGTCLAALQPGAQATLLRTPVLVGIGLLQGATSGGAPADLFSAGALRSWATVGEYRHSVEVNQP